jgi:lambda repressor-like predicted transcriptional regulator
MSTTLQEQVAWVRAILAYLGVSPTELARRAKLAPSTLHRPLNEPAYPGVLSGRTLGAIAEVAGVRPLEYPARMRGMAEPEALAYVEPSRLDPGDNVGRAVRELVAGRNGRDAWVAQNHALDLAGILPGDIVIVDLNLQPKARDIVCAQIYDWSGTRTETVFRVFDAPFLLTRSTRIDDKPLTVDGTTVVIKGVVTAVLRASRAAA